MCVALSRRCTPPRPEFKVNYLATVWLYSDDSVLYNRVTAIVWFSQGHMHIDKARYMYVVLVNDVHASHICKVRWCPIIHHWLTTTSAAAGVLGFHQGLCFKEHRYCVLGVLTTLAPWT